MACNPFAGISGSSLRQRFGLFSAVFRILYQGPPFVKGGPRQRAGIDPQIFIEIRNRKIRLRLSPVPYCRAFASLLAADGTVRLFLTGRVLQ